MSTLPFRDLLLLERRAQRVPAEKPSENRLDIVEGADLKA